MSKRHKVPGIATSVGGEIQLDGPGPIAISMTSDAARKTGESLLKAAERSPDPATPGKVSS
jgi:hypothetical protein